MVDSPALFLPEQQLAAELAVEVAGCLWAQLGQDLVEGQIYTAGLSHYGWGCQALCRVGVYQPGPHHTRFIPLIPLQDVRAHMRAQEPVDHGTLEALLRAGLGLLIEEGSGLSASREAFVIPQTLHRLAELFDACGYAHWDGAQLRWADKIAPLMVSCSLWEQEGTSLADSLRAKVEAEARLLLTKMPNDLRRRVRKGLAARDDFEALQEMQRAWRESGWCDDVRLACAEHLLHRQPEQGLRTFKVALQLLRAGSA